MAGTIAWRRTSRPAMAVTMLASSGRELRIAGVVAAWILTALAIDRTGGLWLQRALGGLTWLILLRLLGRESSAVRAQVAVLVVFATAVEYTASPLLGLYTYRLDNVPAFVPPGHGMVYLAALALGRSTLFARWVRPLVVWTLVVGGAWAWAGLLWSSRPDLLGAMLFGGLVGFLLAGRAPPVYVGAFLITTYLELVGTRLGAWTWARHDPSGLVSIGNPPSGIPGGYCVLDATALYLAPVLEHRLAAMGSRVQRWLGAGRGARCFGRLAGPRRSRCAPP
jgi:hypothetical protein